MSAFLLTLFTAARVACVILKVLTGSALATNLAIGLAGVMCLRAPSKALRPLGSPLLLQSGLAMLAFVFAMRKIPNWWIADLPPFVNWWVTTVVAGWLLAPRSGRARVVVVLTMVGWAGVAVWGRWDFHPAVTEATPWRVASLWVSLVLSAAVTWVAFESTRRRVREDVVHIAPVVSVGLVAVTMPYSLLTLAHPFFREVSFGAVVSAYIMGNVVIGLGALAIAGVARSPT